MLLLRERNEGQAQDRQKDTHSLDRRPEASMRITARCRWAHSEGSPEEHRECVTLLSYVSQPLPLSFLGCESLR